ncbi:hypothetical protein FE257_003170 [Aspergillus nanangensis]|uniref:Peroxisomal membrane protein PEX14 n=1 Tax=Aspergillus nanangensis TaxID=2582783 RepID=A0AAD4GNP0_ASPNN|nr:hypothetical protein FE257_003170 [Aspergillus nanangensis]
MSDPKPKSASIPSWQQPNATATTKPTAPSPDNATGTSRSTLVDQASKFLEDDSIRDAPIDRKISFLESKGLDSNEIDKLLGVSRNPEATNTTVTAEEKTTSTPEPSSKNESNNAATSSSAPSPPSSTAPANNNMNPPPAATTTPSTSPRNVTPIITYPEFLVNQPKPPPLVSLQSILYTIYGAAGLGASIYGASEFLVKPMLASLSSARHDLASTAATNLQKLNEKLEQNVSVIPPQLTARKTTNAADPSEEDDDEAENESITSDPTELFHRDVATQTSQDIAQESASKAVNSADDAILPDPTAMVTTHQKRLEVITSNLREFADAEKESGTVEDTMRTNLNELQHFLDGLLYSKPGFGGVTGYGVYSTPGIDTNGSTTGIAKGEEEAISNFRSEIRGVKGALLSARNFPSGRGGRVGSAISR